MTVKVKMQQLENMYRCQRYFYALELNPSLKLHEELNEVISQATALAVDYRSLRNYVNDPKNGIADGY